MYANVMVTRQPSAVIMIANPLCMHKGNGFNFVSMINTVIFIKEKSYIHTQWMKNSTGTMHH